MATSSLRSRNTNSSGPRWGSMSFGSKMEVVEHWDNLEEKCSHLNLSGRSQLDGPTEIAALDKTESNKNVVKGYFDSVIFQGQRDKVSQYRSMDNFRQHSCDGEDNKSGFQQKTAPSAKPGFV